MLGNENKTTKIRNMTSEAIRIIQNTVYDIKTELEGETITIVVCQCILRIQPYGCAR